MTRKTDYEFKNLTKSQLQCLSVIEGLGIYELRALSRIFGGASPSTLKRNDHIKLVMDKIISGEEIRPAPLRQGRPYKEISNIQGILEELSAITGKDYITNKPLSGSHFKKEISFKQLEENVISKQLFPIKAKGVLCKNSNEDFFFYNQYNFKFVLVKRDMCDKLLPFDFVEGTAVLMNNNNEYMLKTIERINFEDIASYSGKSNRYRKCLPHQNISFGDTTITLGCRYRINNLTKFIDKKEQIASLVLQLKKHNIFSMAVVPNIPDEDLLDIQTINFDNLMLFRYNEKSPDFYQNVLAINDCIKRQQELGKSLAIFVQDPVTIMNMIDYCYKTQPKLFMEHTEATAEFLKDFGSLIMAGEDGKNTTCFFTCDTSDLYDPMYVSLIYKVFKPIDL